MPRRFIIAGLDYGTSFTKIVIRDNNTPGRNAQVVTTNDCQDGLFPSLIGLRDGHFIFPPIRDGAAEIPYLKMLTGPVAGGERLKSIPIRLPREVHALAESIGEDTAFVRSLMAFYFAHIISAVEAFIGGDAGWHDFDFSRNTHDDHLIFQLAVPSGLMDDAGAAENLFREALIAGYQLRDHALLKGSAGAAALEWHRAVESQLESVAGRKEQFEWQCLIYPETAGAVQAYFRSPNASDGLFVTMDVGAGTVDLNAFRRGPRLRNCDYYATIVCPLGRQNIQSPLVSNSPRGKEAIMEELRYKVYAINLLARRYQPNRGTQPGMRTWDHATFFIFGGGAHYRPYWDSYEAGLTNVGIHEPQILKLPFAQDLTRPQGVDFGRFAVAYGLSFFKPSLDQVRLPHELKTFDELYPRSDEPQRPYGFNWED